MPKPPQKVPVVFYRTPAGSEVVRDWLKRLPAPDRNAIGQDLMRVQFRWPVGMPLCRPMRDGVWELRTDLSGNRIARLLFSFLDGHLVALSGFIKKTRKTSDDEIERALKRKREFSE